MSSCVLNEQNELVVRTGLNLRLRQLDTTKINKDTCVFVVDGRDSKHFNASMCHVISHMTKALFDSGIPSGEIHKSMPNVQLVGSIVDIPKEVRSNNVIICFDESAYNGRQSLYHLFGGEKRGLKTYQMFIDAMTQTQKNGDAIVFTPEEIKWFPGVKDNKQQMIEDKFLELKKQVDSFTRNYSSATQFGFLIIRCARTDKWYWEWINMVEKLLLRLEEHKMYPDITILSDIGDTRNYLSYAPYVNENYETYTFDVEQEWSSHIIMKWILDRHLNMVSLQPQKKEVKESVVEVPNEQTLQSQLSTLTETIKSLTDVVSKLSERLV